VRLRWKKPKDGEQEHRLRRGDLTLAIVGPAHGSFWYFRGRVPGGGSENTLARPTSGEDGPRTWADLEEAKAVAAEWVEREEKRAVAQLAGAGVR
jgi:hypothetical protein